MKKPRIIILLLIGALLMMTCKNELLTVIEEEVGTAVTPPSVTGVFPEDKAAGVAVNLDTITIDFTKAIEASSVNKNTLQIKDQSGNAVAGSYSVSSGTVSFDPSGSLSYLSTYTITLTSGVVDTDGNPVSEEFSWTFTTTFDPNSDQTPPSVEELIINDGASATNSTTISLDIFADDNAGRSGLQYKLRLSGNEWPEVWTELDDEGIALDIPLELQVEIDNVQGVEAVVKDAEGNISVAKSALIMYESTPPLPILYTPTGSSVPGDTRVVTVTFNEGLSALSVSTSSVYVEDSNGSSAATMGEAAISLKEYNNIPDSVIEITGVQLEQFETYFIVITTGVEDIAGNPLGEEKVFDFSTSSALDQTPPEVDISINSLIAPPGSETFLMLDNGIEATNWNNVKLDITASDDFNGVKDMKIWEGTSSEPAAFTTFESTFDIDIDPLADGSGIKYIYYKVRDWANNVSDGYIQIVLDKVLPVVSSLTIDGGASHTTAADRIVALDFTYSDDLPSGIKMTGVTDMAVSNDDFASGTDWLSVDLSIPEWELTELNGTKTVYIKVRDTLGQESATVEQNIIWDTEPPEIVIQTSQYLEVNTGTIQNATISDEIDSSPDILWTQVSGPGAISFSDSALAEPTVSANADGDYELNVSVTDEAGHSTSLTIPFVWDQTKPENTLSVTVPTFNTDKQPTWSWVSVGGSDYYKVSFLGSPNWSDPADYTEVYSTDYTSETQLSDGDHSLKVSAWDRAGNKADTESSALTTVDTVSPVIYGAGALFLTNTSLTLDFTDQATKDGEFTDSGSGVDTFSILWEEIGGSSIVFTGAGTATPGLSVPTSVIDLGERGVFDFRVNVSDLAGNTNSATFTLDWDREPPNLPIVEGLRRTPNTTPTYSWTSGGNYGSGYFRYRFEGDSSWINGSDGTAVYSYTPSSSLPFDNSDGSGDEYTTGPAEFMHTLEVQEKDLAGNWSASGDWTIYVDKGYVSPPDISITADIDGNISPRTTTSVTWNWTSGADIDSASDEYRFRTSENGGSSWTSWSVPTGANSYTLTPASPPTSGMSYFLIEVEEYNASVLTGKPQISTAVIDLQGPTPPSITSATRTKDQTPVWYWSSAGGSDGIGLFQYKLDTGDWSDPVTQTAFTPSSALTEGAHILYVQEQDPLGNWSTSASKTVTIDITPPVLNYVQIHTDTDTGSTEIYSNSVNVNLYLNANTSGETGLEMSVYNYGTGSWGSWQSFSSWTTAVLSDGEGVRYSYARLRDDVGNISTMKNDTITLDQTPPANHSIVLNNGENYTPVKDAKFNAAATDNYTAAGDIEVQHAYYNGTSWYKSSWEPIGENLYFDSIFTNSTGWKYVYARFRDAAGNVTAGETPTSGWVSDSVYMKLVTMRYAHKGYYADGNVNVYYNESYSPASVAYVTRYYIYSTTDPDANPNISTSGFTYEGYADQTASAYKTVNIPKGEIRYFWVRPYNSDLGGYGYFSPSGVMGFSSNVTIIYNEGHSTDEAIAAYTKELLENTYYAGGINYEGYISGTMPTYTVTLLPEDLIDNSGYSYYYRIYGDPVIITPYTTFAYNSDTYDNRIQNIVTNNRGIIAMGYNGYEFLNRVNVNWSAWSLSGTQPSKIDFTKKVYLGTSTSGKKKPNSLSENIWSSPLSNNYLTSSYGESTITLGLFTSSVYRYGVNLGSSPAISDGATYAYGVSSTSYHTVVRQGRFMLFGYYDTPGRNYTLGTNGLKYQYGQPFFINLIARMDNY